MKHIGIIAEYNPLHLGHARQLDYVRRVLHADCISVVMSGDFVQRGAPAWTDKYLRTRMALSSGADLILALPVRYSLSSAEGFARGGVSTLAALGVDGICFGTEADSPEQLRDIAARLHTLRHSADYDDQLRAHLRRGLTYPQALTQMLSSHGICCAEDLLSSPNNILALCYLEQLQELAPQITPYALPRNDNGYHDTDASGSIISASAIRAHLTADSDLPQFRDKLPTETWNLLQDTRHFGIGPDDFSAVLYYHLRNCQDPGELQSCGISEDLSRRILRELPQFDRVSTFLDHLKTRNQTYSGISRGLFRFLLNVQPQTPAAPYARLLGLRSSHSRFLRASRIPVITKVADAHSILPSESLPLWSEDLRAADLYRFTANARWNASLPGEYQRSPLLISP